jgi:hypothetical protein
VQLSDTLQSKVGISAINLGEPLNRYCQRQSLLPVAVINGNRPPPSDILLALSRFCDFETFVFVSFPTYIVPEYLQFGGTGIPTKYLLCPWLQLYRHRQP